MDPVLLVFGTFAWIAPAVVTGGAVAYGVLTTPRRRARRLDLDASRRESATAYTAYISAKAEARSANAQVLAARARATSPARSLSDPGVIEARRQLQTAKLHERSAVLLLRATRSRVKASAAQYRAAGSSAPLPVEKLMAAQDAVTARWMEYETDPGRALSFPQMLDASHPSTLAFLRAHRAAKELRPASAREKMTPETYLAYRDAVRAVEAAFSVAEQDAHGTTRSSLPQSWARVAEAARDAIWAIPLRDRDDTGTGKGAT